MMELQVLRSLKQFSILLILACFTNSHSTESRAHHKVHNLALYPERHSWCQATPIRQEIAHAPECHTKTIDNVVCLGACFSYSVPKAQDDPVIPPYCDACRPTISAWKVVTLNCTKATTGEPYQLAKNVEIISNCSCVDCNDNTPRGIANEEPESVEDGGLLPFERNNEVEQDVEGEAEDEEDEDEDGKSLIDNLPPIPSLHKLKSVSEELKELNKAADEELMINGNQIPSDDDHHDPAEAARILKERERHRLAAVVHSDVNDEV